MAVPEGRGAPAGKPGASRAARLRRRAGTYALFFLTVLQSFNVVDQTVVRVEGPWDFLRDTCAVLFLVVAVLWLVAAFVERRRN